MVFWERNGRLKAPMKTVFSILRCETYKIVEKRSSSNTEESEVYLRFIGIALCLLKSCFPVVGDQRLLEMN